jgi:hypothetical protein
MYPPIKSGKTRWRSFEPPPFPVNRAAIKQSRARLLPSNARLVYSFELRFLSPSAALIEQL